VETGRPGEGVHASNLSIGAGIASLNDATNIPPYALSMSLAPAAFVRLAHSTNYAIWFAGDQLICSNASLIFKLNTQTGKLVELTATGEESSQAKLDLRFEPGAFESAMTKIEHDGAGFTNVCQTNAPLGSAIAFFGGELVQLPFVNSFLQTQLPADTCAQLPAILRQLGNEDFLSPFEEIFKNLRGETNDVAEDFEIPQKPGWRPAGDGLIQAELATGALWIFAGGDLIFPPRSWPWTVLRDAAFALRGETSYLHLDMAEIYASNETGPIGYLASAQFLKIAGSSAARSMAQRGLRQLSIDAFRRDYRVLLDEHYLAGQFTARLAATLGALNKSQMDVLVMSMNATQAEFVRDCAKRARVAQKGQPFIEIISPALDAYWENRLKQSVGAQLKKIAGD
jgi:hypothetical protein